MCRPGGRSTSRKVGGELDEASIEALRRTVACGASILRVADIGFCGLCTQACRPASASASLSFLSGTPSAPRPSFAFGARRDGRAFAIGRRRHDAVKSNPTGNRPWSASQAATASFSNGDRRGSSPQALLCCCGSRQGCARVACLLLAGIMASVCRLPASKGGRAHDRPTAGEAVHPSHVRWPNSIEGGLASR